MILRILYLLFIQRIFIVIPCELSPNNRYLKPVNQVFVDFIDANTGQICDIHLYNKMP